MINPPEVPMNGEARNDAHFASTSVRLYWRTPRFDTSKKTERGTIVMFQNIGSENQLKVHNYLSIPCYVPLIAQSVKSHVTMSLIGCAPHT